MASITIYVTHDDYSYLKDNQLGASELFKKAIIMHKEGQIREERFYLMEIERLTNIIKKLQNTITQVGELKWHIEK